MRVRWWMIGLPFYWLAGDLFSSFVFGTDPQGGFLAIMVAVLTIWWCDKED